MMPAPPVVLICDDSATNLHVLNKILRSSYRVKAARSGAKALQIAGRDRPSLILLDVQMPDMDGPEVCRRLKQDPATAFIPVLFISGSNAERAACEAAGGVALLVKPVEPDRLLACVERYRCR